MSQRRVPFGKDSQFLYFAKARLKSLLARYVSEEPNSVGIDYRVTAPNDDKRGSEAP